MESAALVGQDGVAIFLESKKYDKMVNKGLNMVSIRDEHIYSLAGKMLIQIRYFMKKSLCLKCK